MLRISDTGTGMSQEVIEKMFDPFFTTKEVGKGTGLGLSTALGIVKSHGGFISVKSEVGKGTTFELLLPAAPSEEGIYDAKTVATPLSGHGQLILVVDDEPSILSITKLILESSDYGVICADDGPEALAAFSEHKDKISAVLTDMMLPHMGGATLIRELKKIKPDTVCIASSGLGKYLTEKELEGVGASELLAKPYDTHTLLTTLQQALS
jgi:CheY-like chemotaxis protein